ncbi:MAG: hypothetical protein GY703_07455 [Gammaproteobacteria bacterium]|nr:hypothetical protein [Gammaproteobacteria bacterium]
MRHVMIQVMTEELSLVSLTLAELSVFSPDHRPIYEDRFPHIPGGQFREYYHQGKSRLEKITRHIPLSPQVRLQSIQVVDERKLRDTNEWLGEVWQRCSILEEALRHLREEEQLIRQLEQTLENFENLNIDLNLLREERLFLDLRIGMVPRTNVSQLQEALGLSHYLLFVYMEHENNAHVVVVGPRGEREEELGSVLDTAGFHTLPIPPELRDEPENIRRELDERRHRVEQDCQLHRETLKTCSTELRNDLEEARRTLIMAEPFVRMDTAARSSGYLSIISGWIPAREIQRTRESLSDVLVNPFRLEERKPSREERPLVPSCLPEHWLMSPFATLVKQYGVPRYGEVDPTALFAITFIAMFGMMFGDVGHGLTIVLVAWLFRWKLRSFTPFAVCIGLSATLFGFLYGAVFGYEEMFHAVWMPPLSDPLYMLGVALRWGIGYLLMITLISIHNRLMEGDVTRAVFDSNGLVSIVLYLTVLYGLWNHYTHGVFGLAPLLISVTALLVLLAYRLIETDAPPGERMLVALIETFETVTGYISNTLSFLRVAAFSFNHVALTIAVFQLVSMLESTQGQWLMVILGNVFILVLEGAIVTIQALRLEYYEGFSRFYSGDGKEFRPLRLETVKGV